MTPEIEPLLTPEQVAEVLAVDGVAAVYELTRARARDPLPALRVGKYLRVRPSELHEWLERQRVRRAAAR